MLNLMTYSKCQLNDYTSHSSLNFFDVWQVNIVFPQQNEDQYRKRELIIIAAEMER